MKQLLLLVCLALSANLSFAQNTICYIDNALTEPGLYPTPDSIPCMVNGRWNDVTLQFMNFDSATISGIRVRVEYIIIDSILNLPCGITWSTSNLNSATKHRFENKEKGCIRFWGHIDDVPGQYKLKIKIKAKVSLLPNEVPYTAESLGYRVDVRVKDNACDACPPLDTNAVLQTAACISIDKDTVYGGGKTSELDTVPCVGINEIKGLNHFSFYPNPTNSTASVSFTAENAATYTTRIINIYGAEVSRDVMNVTSGLNVSKLDVSSLAAGVYIYTITDGKNVQTQRFVVEK